MHVTGGTLQLEQAGLTATQLDTNVAAGEKRKRKLRQFLQQWPSCFQPRQVRRLRGKRLPYGGMSGLGMFLLSLSSILFIFRLTLKESMLAKVASPCLNRHASVSLDIPIRRNALVDERPGIPALFSFLFLPNSR